MLFRSVHRGPGAVACLRHAGGDRAPSGCGRRLSGVTTERLLVEAGVGQARTRMERLERQVAAIERALSAVEDLTERIERLEAWLGPKSFGSEASGVSGRS
jgi:hypothetical protein